MRTLIRALLVLTLAAVLAFVGFIWWTGASIRPIGPTIAARQGESPVGTSGTIDRETARERGAELGGKAAVAAAKMEQAVHEAGQTAKIKAKMALDDQIKARSIDVTTNGSIVTLSGTVRSPQEHDRAVRLARETAGVTGVVDHLRVE